tara:strand:+ start:1043 stop:1531 length:489 start_codon:yes stop_codon:yes gene_type:complete
MEKKNMKKKAIALVCFFFIQLGVYAQSFNEDKMALANFVKRMYSATSFEGVKIVDDYNHQYLVSVISLEKAKYTSESTMNRVAQLKAQSQASAFLNGANISMDMVITTKESKDSANNVTTIVESVEQIRQNSVGFSQGLELLSVFSNGDDKRMVFIYGRAIK